MAVLDKKLKLNYIFQSDYIFAPFMINLFSHFM